jgi:hypothetical protein
MAAVDQRSLLVDVQKACQDFTGGAGRATAPVNCKATTAKREQRRPVRSAVRNMASIIRKFKEAPASISAICRQSDSSDAGLLVDLLVHHREKLRRIHPDTEQTRILQFLVEARRKFISDKTRYSNRLTAYLKIVFPAGSGLVQ